MVQVMINLLSNASKFVPEGQGQVRIELRARADGYQVRVEDNGPGVPQPYREAIFEKFRQVSGSGSMLKDKPRVPGWGSRSAARSSSISAAGSGPRTRPWAGPRSASPCRWHCGRRKPLRE